MSAAQRILVKCAYCGRCLIDDPKKFSEDDLRAWRIRHEVNECV